MNRASAPYGSGWWVEGLERIVPVSATRLLWIAGDGSTRIYTQSGSVFRAPNLDRPDSITTGGAFSGWVRHAPMQGQIAFDASGRHRRSTNRLGHQTNFAYTGSAANDPLDTVTLPTVSGTLLYDFAYNGSAKLDSVLAPGNRGTKVYIASAVVDSIRDADITKVRFTYGSSPNEKRMASRNDRRGYTTSYSYDAANRLSQHSRTLEDASTITVNVAVAETRSVPGSSYPTAQPLDSVYTSVDGPRSDVADVTRFWITGLGLPYRVRDPLGRETVVTYDATWPAQVKTSRAPNALRSRMTYTSRALADSLIVENTLGTGADAVTTYAWHSTFELPTSITLPASIEPTQFGYNSTTGNREWQQQGNSSSRRVNFFYDGNGLLKEIAPPLSPADSLFYNSLGNVERIRSPLGFHSRFLGDAIGRDTLVFTPLSASDSLKERRVYDVLDRITDIERIAPQVAAPNCSGCVSTTSYLTKTLTIENTYDDEGNPTAVTRSSTGSIGVTDSFTQYVYDYAGRLVRESPLGPVGGQTKYVLDAAGNVTQRITPRSDTIRTIFDAAGQPMRTVIPGVFHGIAGCTVQFTVDANGRHSPCYLPFDSLRVQVDTVRFRYDGMGQLVHADNNDARITRTYFPNGLLRSEEQALRGYNNFTFTGYTLQHRYDLAGRRTVLKHPSGLAPARDSVIFGYLAWGPLQQVTGMEAETYAYAYDDAQRTAVITLPGSVKDTSRFDGESRVVRREVIRPSETLIDDTLTYNRQAKILTGAMSGTIAGGGGSVTNWYDGLGAVIASDWRNHVNAGFQADEYAYDAHGNQGWAHKMDAGTMNDTLGYAFDGAGRLETIEPVSGFGTTVKPFTYRDYDASGNTSYGAEVRKSSTSSSWVTSRSYYGADEKLRMFRRISSAPVGSRADVVDEYRYDALGRRVLLRSDHASNCDVGPAECFSAIQRFLWDGDQLVWELRNSGTSEIAVGSRPYGGKIAYVHGVGIDRPLGVLLGGDSLIVPHVNWRGAYIGGTYVNGDKVGDSNVSWMGATVRVSFEGGSLEGHWWGGLLKEQLDASGMLYRRNRYYDAATGRVHAAVIRREAWALAFSQFC